MHSVELNGANLEIGANKNEVVINTKGKDGNNRFVWPLEVFEKLAVAVEKCRRQIPRLNHQIKEDSVNDVITMDILKISDTRKIKVTVNKVNGRFYLSASTHIYDTGDWHWLRKRCLRIDLSQDDMQFVYECLTGQEKTDFFN